MAGLRRATRDAERLRVRNVHDIARTELASTPPLGLAVDGDRERADEVLGLAARVDDAGELQQLAEADELARHLYVTHPRPAPSRPRPPQAMRVLCLRFGGVVVAGARPGSERQQDAGVLGGTHAVTLARLEQDDRALRARHRVAPTRELDAAARDLDDRPLVHLVLAESLAGGEIDHDHARLGRREQHPRVGSACGVCRQHVPELHAQPLSIRLVGGR